MGTRTPDQVKEEMILKLGSDFGTLLNNLYNEITWLSLKWSEFVQLFGSKESRIELMNEAASTFFFTVQRVLRDDILISIARLTDPIESRGSKNITIKAIPQFLSGRFKETFQKDLDGLIIESSFCREWRNKRIAHMDYWIESAKPLEPATKVKIDSIIAQIQTLYNKLSNEYFNTETVFHLITTGTGAIALLHRIEGGIKYDKEIYKRKLQGNWTNDESPTRV